MRDRGLKNSRIFLKMNSTIIPTYPEYKKVTSIIDNKQVSAYAPKSPPRLGFLIKALAAAAPHNTASPAAHAPV